MSLNKITAKFIQGSAETARVAKTPETAPVEKALVQAPIEQPVKELQEVIRAPGLKNADEMRQDTEKALKLNVNHNKKNDTRSFFKKLVSRVKKGSEQEIDFSKFISMALRLEKITLLPVTDQDIQVALAEITEVLTDKDRGDKRTPFHSFIYSFIDSRETDKLAYIIKNIFENTQLRPVILPYLQAYIKGFIREKISNISYNSTSEELEKLTIFLEVNNKAALMMPNSLLDKIITDTCNDVVTNFSGNISANSGKFFMSVLITRGRINLAAVENFNLSLKNQLMINNTKLLLTNDNLAKLAARIDLVTLEEFSFLNNNAAQLVINRPGLFNLDSFYNLRRMDEIYKMADQKKSLAKATPKASPDLKYIKVKTDSFVSKFKNTAGVVSSAFFNNLVLSLNKIALKKLKDGTYCFSDLQMEKLIRVFCSENYRMLDMPAKKLVIDFLGRLDESSPIFFKLEEIFAPVQNNEEVVAIEASFYLLSGYENLVKILSENKDPFFNLIIFSFGKESILNNIRPASQQEEMHLEKLRLLQKYFMPVTIKLLPDDYKKVMALKPDEMEILFDVLQESFELFEIINKLGGAQKVISETHKQMVTNTVFKEMGFTLDEVLTLKLKMSEPASAQNTRNYTSNKFNDLAARLPALLRNNQGKEIIESLKNIFTAPGFANLKAEHLPAFITFLGSPEYNPVIKENIISELFQLFSAEDFYYLVSDAIKKTDINEFYSLLNDLLRNYLIKRAVNNQNYEEFPLVVSYLDQRYGIILEAINEVLTENNLEKANSLFDFLDAINKYELEAEDKRLFDYLLSKFEVQNIFNTIDNRCEDLLNNEEQDNRDSLVSDIVNDYFDKLENFISVIQENIVPELPESGAAELILKWIDLKNNIYFYLNKVVLLSILNSGDLSRLEDFGEKCLNDFMTVPDELQQIKEQFQFKLDGLTKGLKENNLQYQKMFSDAEKSKILLYYEYNEFLAKAADIPELKEYQNMFISKFFLEDEAAKAKTIKNDKQIKLKTLRGSLTARDQQTASELENDLFSTNRELITLNRTLQEKEGTARNEVINLVNQNIRIIKEKINELELIEADLAENIQAEIKANREYLLKLEKIIINHENDLNEMAGEIKEPESRPVIFNGKELEHYIKVSESLKSFPVEAVNNSRVNEIRNIFQVIYFLEISISKAKDLKNFTFTSVTSFENFFNSWKSLLNENILHGIRSYDRQYLTSYFDSMLEARKNSVTFYLSGNNSLKYIDENYYTGNFVLKLYRQTKEKIKLNLYAGNNHYNSGFLLKKDVTPVITGNRVFTEEPSQLVFERVFSSTEEISRFAENLASGSRINETLNKYNGSTFYFNNRNNLTLKIKGIISELTPEEDFTGFRGRLLFPLGKPVIGNFGYFESENQSVNEIGINLVNYGKYIHSRLTEKNMEEYLKKLITELGETIRDNSRELVNSGILNLDGYELLFRSLKTITASLTARQHSEYFQEILGMTAEENTSSFIFTVTGINSGNLSYTLKPEE